MQNLSISPTEAKAELAQRELARRHLIDFNKYVYSGYETSWHIELLCEALDKVFAGEIRFLIVEMPPRHSKSLNVSQLFPAYIVGKDRDAPIIVASYSGDLATDHGRETRNLIDTQLYKNVFDTQLAPDSTAKGKWNTNGRGAYTAAGVGGSITGKGAKFFVVDDPFKDRKEADSPIIREDRWKWFRSVARTRLTPDGRMVVMHTRWHDDDLIGRITRNDSWVDYFDFLNGKEGKWVRLVLPAIAEKEDKFRKIGDPIWPTRYSHNELMDIKSSIGSYEWSALYQQNPIDEEHQEFKKDWVKYRTLDEVEKLITRRIATIDTALSKHAKSDFTGVTRNYIDLDNRWNLRSTRYKISSKELIDLIFLLHYEGFDTIGIEEGAYLEAVKPFLDDEMKKRNKFPNVVVLKHGGVMKETRIRGLIPRYETKSVFHIDKDCVDLEEEMFRFPKGVHDDCIDSVAYQLQIAVPPMTATELQDFNLYSSNFK